jgi:beta-glucosidase
MQGRTYKYMKESPLYPFGFGLTYGKLVWEKPSVNNGEVKKDQGIEISIKIKNTGSIYVEDVIQLYLTIDNSKEHLPLASLIDFKRASFPQGAENIIKFSVPHKEFSYYNSEGKKVQHHGKATITIANASPGERSKQLGSEAFTVNVVVE